VGHRTQDSVKDFQNPLITAYFSVDYQKNPKGTNYWRNRVLKVAKEFVGQINFAIASKDDFQHELNEYGYDFVGDKPVVLARDESERLTWTSCAFLRHARRNTVILHCGNQFDLFKLVICSIMNIFV